MLDPVPLGDVFGAPPPPPPASTFDPFEDSEKPAFDPFSEEPPSNPFE